MHIPLPDPDPERLSGKVDAEPFVARQVVGERADRLGELVGVGGRGREPHPAGFAVGEQGEQFGSGRHGEGRQGTAGDTVRQTARTGKGFAAAGCAWHLPAAAAMIPAMQRRLFSVLGNSQKLDGGAMFGNAPKALWTRWASADDHNRIDLACRALLVREPGRNILFEAGIGAFFAPDLQRRYGVQQSNHVLLDNLRALGLQPDDIDVVVLSHLHFDHAGGVLSAWRDGEAPRLVFPRAQFVVGEVAWQRALRPHARDRQSFVAELPALLEGSGRLERVAEAHSDVLGPDYRFHRSDGHTPGMLLAEVPGERGPIVFAGDLMPGVAWVRRAITMGYDRFPELVIDEKAALLDDLVARHGRLFFTHDPQVALGALQRDDQGQVVVGDTLAELRGEAA